jgi:nitrate reductase NapE component
MTETTAGTLYCYVHPNRETSLRCNNCNRPICASCAVRTPTGYRCKECVKGQQQIFNTAEWYDYIIGFVLAAILSSIASFLVTLVGGIGFIGWFLVIAGAPAAGAIIAEALRYALRKHRSRNLFITVAVGVVLGALPTLLTQIFIGNFYGIIFQVIYLVLATPVVYTRLSGIRLSR